MAGMRGDDREPDAMFSYVSAKQRVPKDHPLRAIRALVDEVLGWTHCVTVDVLTSPDNPIACGWRSSNSVVDGVYDHRSQVHLKPGYDSWPLAAQNWAVAHEFGHLLGLDVPDCEALASVMHDPITCGADST